jgi:hypothetical protein
MKVTLLFEISLLKGASVSILLIALFFSTNEKIPLFVIAQTVFLLS